MPQQDGKHSIWQVAAQAHSGPELFHLSTELREAIDVVLALSRCRSHKLHQVFEAKSEVAVTSVLADAPRPSQRLSEKESKHQVDLTSPSTSATMFPQCWKRALTNTAT